MTEKKPNTKSNAKTKPGKTSTTGSVRTVRSAESTATSTNSSRKKASGSSTAKTKPSQTKRKSKKWLLIGIMAAVILVVVGVVIALLSRNNIDPSSPTANLDYSESFFIQDGDEYRIWNAEGKQLTNDKYDTYSDFVGGYAMVKKGDQYGIIREDGKMSVDFGKYNPISPRGGLYEAEDANTGVEYLITATGKVLESGEDLDIIYSGMSSGYAAVINNGKLKVYNLSGTLILETDAISDEENPYLNYSKDFGLVHYGGKNWLFDARDGKVLASFDGEKYSFDGVANDRKTILLSNYDNSNQYKLYKNGKIYDLNELKYYGLTELGDVLGYDDFSELAILNDEYKVKQKVDAHIQYKDSNTYAVKKSGDNGGIEIWSNGKVVKEFGEGTDIVASNILHDDFFAFEDEDGARFYTLSGEEAFNHTFEDIDNLFDKNHLAIVSDDGDAYYLINTKGEKVNDIMATDYTYRIGGYRAENSDGRYAIINKNGKPVTDFKYTSAYYRDDAEPRSIWTGTLENKNSDVIDADSGKVIVSDVAVDSFYNNYFTTTNVDGGTDYYTYNGTLFFTENAD